MHQNPARLPAFYCFSKLSFHYNVAAKLVNLYIVFLGLGNFVAVERQIANGNVSRCILNAVSLKLEKRLVTTHDLNILKQ